MGFTPVFRTNSGLSLLASATALWLSACAMPGSVQQHCKVYDRDLQQGTYSGGCNGGLADGYGEVSGAASGYRGDFRAGKKHGRGVKVMPNGDVYTGDFADDYRHGKGVYVWGPGTPWAGDRYEGEYRRDLRHGWGVYQWSSGDRYEGPWQDDLRMGLSVMETRRVHASRAAVRALKIGALACVDAPLGLVNRQRISAKVEQIDGVRIQVRIVAVEDGVAGYLGRVVRAGDVFSDEAVHWRPCEQR